MSKWVKRWGYEAQATSSKGVMRLRNDGYLLFAKVTDAGRARLVMRVLRDGSQHDAERERLVMISEAKATAPTSRPRFDVYAPQLFERKIEQREIKSAKTRDRWASTLELHLLPAFGSCRVDAIEKLQVEAWKSDVAKKIASGMLSPRTANGWLSILLVILRAAIDDYGLERDPTRRVRYFPTSEHPTYTEEDPNALTPKQCAAFLKKMRALYPQFFAMVVLGFCTGLRPSTLRPLRRGGPNADIIWREHAMLVRRSNALGQEVMNTTKTARVYKLGLPSAIMAILRAHAKSLRGRRGESELLFPSARGGFMSRSALDKPFARCSKAARLPFTLTPRGMRRTFQDLCRDAKVDKDVQRAVCGHETEGMTDLYSTVHPDEMRKAVARLAVVVVAA